MPLPRVTLLASLAVCLGLVLTGCGATSHTTATSSGGSGSGGSGSGGSGTGGSGTSSSGATEYLYASAFASGGSIYAWQINTSTGVLTSVAGQPFQANIGNGDLDCTEGCGNNLAADPLGRFLYFAYVMNTTSGVDSLGVNASTGALTSISNVPQYPGSTSNGMISNGAITADPTGQYVYGNTEAGSPPGTTLYLFGFSVSSTGQLSNIAGSPFPMIQGESGNVISLTPPAVSKNYLFTDLINGSNTGNLQSWSIGANGALSYVTPPAGGIEGIYPPAVTPSGNFVYASMTVNGAGSGQWEIMPYSVGADGSMTSLTSLAVSLPNETEPIQLYLVSPNGNFLYAFGHNATYVYQINGTTGALTLSSTYTNIIAFEAVIDPSSKYLYLSPNSGASGNYVSSDNVVGYQINSSTGALTQISSGTVTLPQSPLSLAIIAPQ